MARRSDPKTIFNDDRQCSTPDETIEFENDGVSDAELDHVNSREIAEQEYKVEHNDKDSMKQYEMNGDIQRDMTSSEFLNHVNHIAPPANETDEQCSQHGRQLGDSIDVNSDAGHVSTEDVHTESEISAYNKTELDATHLPIDRGWAWVILLASLFAHFIVVGQLKCMGIYFVQFQRRFGSSSSETSLIYTVMNASYSIAALLNLTVGSNVPTRLSMFIGVAISCIGSITTGLIYDVRLACLTYGASFGIANAFIMPQISTTISTYFVKRRGFANNAMNSGVSMGAVAFAPLLTILFEYYGYTGSWILLTGFNLQLILIACLTRPMSFYKKKKNKDAGIDEEVKRKLLSGDSGTTENNDLIKHNGSHSNKNGSCERHVELSPEINGRLHNFPIENTDMRRRYFSESDSSKNSKVANDAFINSATSRFASTDIINSSLMDLTLIREKDEQVSENAEDVPTKNDQNGILRKLFDVKLLSNPVFQYYLLCNAFLCSGCGMSIAYLPAHAIESGISEDMAALLVSVPSIIDIFSKFAFGYISDKGWFHRARLMAAACFVLGIAAECMHFMTTFPTMMIYAVCGGVLQGVYFSLFVVVIIDILSMENLKGALGFISLVQGITGGVALPVAGYLRDNSGSYNITFSFIGSLLIAGAILCYFLPNVHAWHENKLKQRDTQDQQV